MCNEAKCCRLALTEATQLWPKRSKASDGICPSAAHTKANPDSDHEDGNAYDLTHNPKGGCDCAAIVAALIGRRDPRVKYLIFNRQIYNAKDGFAPKPYNGRDPHTSHMHCSIYESGRDDTRAWFGGINGAPITLNDQPPGTYGDGSGISTGDALGIVTEVAKDQLPDALKPLAGLVDLAAFLADSENWVRVGEFLAGVVCALVGVTLLVADTRAGKLAQLAVAPETALA